MVLGLFKVDNWNLKVINSRPAEGRSRPKVTLEQERIICQEFWRSVLNFDFEVYKIVDRVYLSGVLEQLSQFWTLKYRE